MQWDSKKTIKNCYYCGKSIIDDNRYFSLFTMYQIIKLNKLFPLGYEYRSRDIQIPRCKNCYKQHSKIHLIYLIIFVCAFFTFYALSIKNNLGFFIALIPSSFGAIVITCLSWWIIEFILIINRKGEIRNENDVAEYPPIAELLSLGWKMYRPDPANVSGEDIAKDAE